MFDIFCLFCDLTSELSIITGIIYAADTFTLIVEESSFNWQTIADFYGNIGGLIPSLSSAFLEKRSMTLCIQTAMLMDGGGG